MGTDKVGEPTAPNARATHPLHRLGQASAELGRRLSESPELSVVISTLGNHAGLHQVLDGYTRQDAATGTFEVLVVTDRAEPDPAAVDSAIGTRSYPVTRLTGPVPGLSANRNAGWRAARAPVVLFTDNDTVPVPQLVTEHLDWHGRFPQEGTVITGLVRWARGVKITPFMKWLDHGIQFDFHSIHSTEATWAHVYGANSSIKRTFLERVGGYDEARLPYGYEDLDWGYRAREHGLRVMLNRRAIVDHWRTMTVEQWQTRAVRLAASEWSFCELHPEIPPWFHTKFSEAMAAPAQSALAPALARFVPQSTPWLGRRVWSRADLYWRQQIAPSFLATWSEMERGHAPALAPGVSALMERASSGGSIPGGPK
jgi:GT2 family glycosyltransferase